MAILDMSAPLRNIFLFFVFPFILEVSPCVYYPCIEYLSIMQSYYLVHVPARNLYTMPSFGKIRNNDTLNTFG
jgi:hypothetical protein